MSFLSKFAITVQNNHITSTQNVLPLPTRLIPVYFKQIVYHDDVNALVGCLRLVRQDPTQSPILKLRVITSMESPQDIDGSTIYSYVQVSLLSIIIFQMSINHKDQFITSLSNAN